MEVGGEVGWLKEAVLFICISQRFSAVGSFPVENVWDGGEALFDAKIFQGLSGTLASEDIDAD